jgi:ABC-type multidrug transport system fused ATPase/permease subunit
LGALIPLFISILQPDAFNSGWLKDMYDFSGLESTTSFTLALSGLIFVFILLKNIVSLWIVRYQAKFSFGLYTYFATRLQRYFYRKGFLYFKSHNSNEIVRDINTVPALFAQNLLLSLLGLLTEMTILLLIVVSITIYDPTIMLMLSAIVVPVFVIFYQLVKNKITALALEANRINAETSKNLYQSIFGYVDVMINNNKEWFFAAYHKNVKRMSQIRTKQFVYNLMPTKVIETTMILGILVIIAYGITMLPTRGDLLILLGVFALAAYRILPSVNRMMMALMNVKSYQFTLGVVEKVKHLENLHEREESLGFNREIRIKDLIYYYPGKKEPVLKGINFKINRGESVGFVGRSGSGKTTLINIMLGFLKPTKGEVCIDDTTLSEDYLVSWRHLIGYVQQEVFLIDGTLAENIALGYGDVDKERVMEVARRARLSELIAELPNGIDTLVGERGSRISGGQRQRIGIARALYSGAKVLFFDEATSSLDTETEKEITEAINNLSGGDLTMIIIAHRLSTLKYCDRIIEISNGELIKHKEKIVIA